MRANEVKPTLATFNAVLSVISSLQQAREQGRTLTLKVLREMQLLGISTLAFLHLLQQKATCSNFIALLSV